MEHKQPTPSVLAKLMGLDEVPPLHPVQKRQRVLSENYLQRVASIGFRGKHVGRQSFRLNMDERKEYKGVFRLLSMSKSAKRNASFVRNRVQFPSDAVVSPKSVEARPVSVGKNSTTSKVDVDLRSLTSITTTKIVLLKPSLGKLDSAATFFASSAGTREASHSKFKRHKGVLGQQISNNIVEMDKSTNQANNMVSFRSRSRFSKQKRRKMGSISAESLKSKVAGDKILAQDPTSRISPSQNLTNIKNMSFCSDVPVSTADGKKQILERWRTTKKYQQVDLSSTKKTKQEVLSIDDDQPNVNPLGTSSPDCRQDGQEILQKEGVHENKGRNLDLCEQVSSTSSVTVLTSQTNSLKGTLLNHEEQWVPAKDDHPVRSLNISVQQDKANTCFGEEPVTPQYSGMEPQSPMSLEEIYQPSPNSVLGPFYGEEMMADPECFKSVSDSLHGLQMQLELLKSETSETYSEGSSMIVSSDDEMEGGYVDDPEENEVVRPFEVEESRDFSYLVDVLSEAGLHSKNLQICLETWHSHEGPISFSVFEALEKRYGEQISWKTSDRRLLFDRINIGLLEILLPAMGVPEWRKPVAGRLSSKNGQALIEEELWELLVSQEKEAPKNAEHVLGKEEKLLDLIEDIQDIGREIENSLIDELVEDVVSMESF